MLASEKRSKQRRRIADRRYTLRDDRFAAHYLDGRTERRVLACVIELHQTLETAFRIAFPSGEALDRALARVIECTCQR